MKLLSLGLLCMAFCADGQPAQRPTCDCPKAFDFVVQALKTNYAGWPDKVTPQNQARFTRFTNQLRTKAAGTTEAQCYGLLARWTQQLKDHHTGVYVAYGPGTPFTENDTAKIRAYFSNWDKLPVDDASAKRYLDRNAKTLAPIEGIWRDDEGSYTVAIVANKTPTRQFAGVVLKADGIYWQPGQVKMEWSAVDSAAYGGTYFMRDHSPATHYAQVKNGELAVSRQGHWNRIYPVKATPPAASPNWNRDYSGRFELRSVHDSTLLLTLPDFDISHKKIIDSLLTGHREQLLKTPYLLIDVRNNGGGLGCRLRTHSRLSVYQPDCRCLV